MSKTLINVIAQMQGILQRDVDNLREAQTSLSLLEKHYQDRVRARLNYANEVLIPFGYCLEIKNYKVKHKQI